jgi:hypothetical protein
MISRDPESAVSAGFVSVLLERMRHLADQAGNFAGSRLSCPTRFTLSDGARPAFERFFRLLTRFRPSLRHA